MKKKNCTQITNKKKTRAKKKENCAKIQIELPEKINRYFLHKETAKKKTKNGTNKKNKN